MKERPILFSAPMVRALLAGSKTQTRRVLKLPDGFEFTGGADDDRDDPVNWGGEDENGMWWALVAGDDVDRVLPCPYGQPGDRLWVRETLQVTRHWRQVSYAADDATCYESDKSPVDERAERLIDRYGTCNFEEPRGVPSIHMPRWASRITLEVTGVRVERLASISESDAIAEGIDITDDGQPSVTFANLWDSINGQRAPWQSNPWVWVVAFRLASS